MEASQHRNLYEGHNISVRGSQGRFAGIRECHAMESDDRKQMQPSFREFA
jgi:hypothetical protein